MNSTVIMPYPSSSYFATDASSGSSSSSWSAEVEGECSFIPVDAVTLLMLLSELHTFADNPSLATKAQQKNAINAFKELLSHKNQALVSKVFEYIDRGQFNALVSGSTYADIDVLIYDLIASFVF